MVLVMLMDAILVVVVIVVLVMVVIIVRGIIYLTGFYWCASVMFSGASYMTPSNAWETGLCHIFVIRGAPHPNLLPHPLLSAPFPLSLQSDYATSTFARV